jgi:hypothetical protein
MKIVTVLKSGGKFNEKQVHDLKIMCDNHASGHDFACLTDMSPDCETIPIQDDWPDDWAKIELFRLPGPFLYLDPDTIITNRINEAIGNLNRYPFGIMRHWDIYKTKKHKSFNTRMIMDTSVLSWTKPQYHIYETFKTKSEFYIDEFSDNNDFVQDYFVDHRLTKPTLDHGYTYSYIEDITDHVAVHKYDFDTLLDVNPNTQRILINHESIIHRSPL